jgi:hypothetical protein
MRPVRFTAEIARSGRITRACPSRSMRRAICGPKIAWAMTYTAETCPARAYSPYSSWIIRTMPIPTIAIGNRESSPAVENAFAPGRARTAP